MERLYIKNFAGITEMDLDFSRITLLIGPQSTGKSIVAKLHYFFRKFLWEIVSSCLNKQGECELDGFMKRKFERYFPAISWSDHFEISYYSEKDASVSITRAFAKQNIIFTYNNKYRELISFIEEWVDRKKRLSGLKSETKTNYFETNPEDYAAFFSTASDLCGHSVSYTPVFIPAGRSFFALMQKNIFTLLLNEASAIDPYILEFGSFYENTKSALSALMQSRAIEPHNHLAALSYSLLDAVYQRIDDHDYLKHKDGRLVGVENTSSGQQEILPLLAIINSLPLLKTKLISGFQVYIEEPEAHLFPSAQRKVTEFIATAFNETAVPINFILTSHSPYILSTCNNLIMACALFNKLTEETQKQVTAIIPEHLMLPLSDVKAYFLDEGKCKTIISDEVGLLAGDKLDSVSEEIGYQFEQLLSLE